MPLMITGQNLKDAVEKQTFIKQGSLDCTEGVKYDFRMSNHILKSSFGRPIDASTLSSSETANLIIEPDEVVFVLSEESLNLPKDMFAQLSPKRKLGQGGVLTLGGLTVDPGYHGKLLVGLLNFSSTPYILKPGKKLMAATFFKLIDDEIGDFDIYTESLTDFPDELIDVMKKYSPVGTGYVKENLDKLKIEMDGLREQLKAQDDWRQRLDRHDEQIDNLLKGLDKEKDSRLSGEDKFSVAIDKLTRSFTLIKGGAFVIYVIAALLLLPLLVEFCKKIFTQS